MNLEWSGDAAAVLQHPSLVVPILSSQPLWLAIVGEVVMRRADNGLQTTLVDLTRRRLFNSDSDSHFERMCRLAFPIRQDPISRLRRTLRSLGVSDKTTWVREGEIASSTSSFVSSNDTERLSRLNVVSESLSLTGSKDSLNRLPNDLLGEMYQSWKLVYSILSELFARIGPTAVLVFNGRFINEGAARAAALTRQIPVFGFDQGSRSNSVAIYRNHVHDRQSAVDAIEHTWAMAEPELRSGFATEWFESRINDPGGGANEHSSDFDKLKAINPRDGAFLISVFTSSSNELFSIDADTGATPENQWKWILRLVEMARANRSLDIHIRVHPNLANNDPQEVQEWKDLAEELPTNVFVHLPESRVNSYQLVKVSDLVLTFGSTITAESAYLGRPVVELSENFWTILGVCRSVRNEEALVPYLRVPKSAAISCQRQQALKYAFWASWGGEALKHAQLTGVNGSLGGVALEPFGVSFRIMRRVYQWLVNSGRLQWIHSKHGLDGRLRRTHIVNDC